MAKYPNFSQIKKKPILLVYKHSRYRYAKEQSVQENTSFGLSDNDPILEELKDSHEKNLECIDAIKLILDSLSIEYQAVCRSDLTNSMVKDRFVISVGGDGTLLDVSHYCYDSLVLGVNSDPKSSVGALCSADLGNFKDVFGQIYDESLKAIPLSRLVISGTKKAIGPMVLNDILFCHKNPAAMSRFILSMKEQTESHRSSGVWISTAAGSTGGILSSGGDARELEDKEAIFRVREPYWTDRNPPKLLNGAITKSSSLEIRSNMTDAKIFVDGPHKSFDVGLGKSVKIDLSDFPFWLFVTKSLKEKRKQIIEQRSAIRKLL